MSIHSIYLVSDLEGSDNGDLGLLGQNCKPYMVVHYTFSIHFFFLPNNGSSLLTIAHAIRPFDPPYVPHAHASVNQGVNISAATSPPNSNCPYRRELDLDDHTDPIRYAK